MQECRQRKGEDNKRNKEGMRRRRSIMPDSRSKERKKRAFGQRRKRSDIGKQWKLDTNSGRMQMLSANVACLGIVPIAKQLANAQTVAEKAATQEFFLFPSSTWTLLNTLWSLARRSRVARHVVEMFPVYRAMLLQALVFVLYVTATVSFGLTWTGIHLPKEP
jgi:hypothetical protein